MAEIIKNKNACPGAEFDSGAYDGGRKDCKFCGAGYHCSCGIGTGMYGHYAGKDRPMRCQWTPEQKAQFEAEDQDKRIAYLEPKLKELQELKQKRIERLQAEIDAYKSK